MMIASGKAMDSKGKWVFIFPIQNLEISKEIKSEFRVDRVRFVTGKKLRSLASTLGIDPSRFELASKVGESLSDRCTYGVVQHGGVLKTIVTKVNSILAEEIDIISASQLLYKRRQSSCPIRLADSGARGFTTQIVMDSASDQGFVRSQISEHPFPLVINKHWKAYHKELFFLRFLKILQGSTNVANSWRDTLARSVRLAGRSFNAVDHGAAFLWNVIALEALISRQGDKYATAIPERIEALLGWIGFWDTANFHTRIEELYQLRCKVVHDARLDLVNPADIRFSEELLMNVLSNLVRHPRLFSCKDDVIAFAEKVAAQKLLGKRLTTRPKTLIFLGDGGLFDEEVN